MSISHPVYMSKPSESLPLEDRRDAGHVGQGGDRFIGDFVLDVTKMTT